MRPRKSETGSGTRSSIITDAGGTIFGATATSTNGLTYCIPGQSKHLVIISAAFRPT